MGVGVGEELEETVSNGQAMRTGVEEGQLDGQRESDWIHTCHSKHENLPT